jgi:hypothetical protein
LKGGEMKILYAEIFSLVVIVGFFTYGILLGMDIVVVAMLSAVLAIVALSGLIGLSIFK